jgi:hypothetical protein
MLHERVECEQLLAFDHPRLSETTTGGSSSMMKCGRASTGCRGAYSHTRVDAVLSERNIRSRRSRK